LRILDVSGLAVGTSMRCRCGAVAPVAVAAPITVRALVCGHCGGAFQAGAAQCPWCDAGIALLDRHLAALCPACFARLSSDARFCPGCGVAVASQALRALADDAACPRCKSGLRVRECDPLTIVECTSCGGLWLEPAVLERLCENAESAALVQRAIAAFPSPTRPVTEDKVMYLPCVTCRALMMRRNFGGSSGVLVDVCRDHGVWLDHDELARVLDFVRGGGLERARAKERLREAARTEHRIESAPALPISESAFDPLTGRARRDSDLLDVLGYIAHIVGRALGP
jgi:Zn-finger nucleic acid-binding protein